MKEKRKLKRYSVSLNVYSQESDELIGYAENLHREGMLMATQNPLDNQKEYKIWFGGKKDDANSDRILISAYCVWESGKDNKRGIYYSGMMFSKPSKEAVEKIQALIDKVKTS